MNAGRKARVPTKLNKNQGNIGNMRDKRDPSWNFTKARQKKKESAAISIGCGEDDGESTARNRVVFYNPNQSSQGELSDQLDQLSDFDIDEDLPNFELVADQHIKAFSLD